jgi:hypothetical protein
MGLQQRERFATVVCLRDHFNAGEPLEKRTDPGPHQVMIVD